MSKCPPLRAASEVRNTSAGAAIHSRVVSRCGTGRIIMPPHLNNKRSTALFGIPLTALVGVGGLAVYWYLEQPQRQVVADTDDVKHLEEGTEETSERERLLAQRQRTLIKTRERLRRGLDSVGFYAD